MQPVAIHQTADGIESTGLSFDDYKKMHRGHVAQRQPRWIPPFALDDAKLQEVLARRLYRYVHLGRPYSPMPIALLDAMATQKCFNATIAPHCQQDIAAWKSHVETVQRAGSYLAFQSAIAYRAWRLGHNSTQVAESLSIAPTTVRVILDRLKRIAQELGYDVGALNHRNGKKQTFAGSRRFPNVRWNPERIKRLAERQHSVYEIAQMIGYPPNEGCNRVRYFLKSIGIVPVEYDPTAPRKHKPHVFKARYTFGQPSWDVKAAAELRKAGMGYEAIRAKLGIVTSHVAMHHYFKYHPELGVPVDRSIRARGYHYFKPTKWDVEKAIALRKAGMSWSRIRKEVGNARGNGTYITYFRSHPELGVPIGTNVAGANSTA